MPRSTKFLIAVICPLVLASGSVWGQYEQELVIEPALPRSNEPITITVTDSGCYGLSQINQVGQDYQIRISYLLGPNEDCANEPNVETSIGPLPTGNYRIALFVSPGGFGANLTDGATIFVGAPVESSTPISDGGINGLYHDPEAPHRYLYVLETDHTTLIVWNTFDSVGNQVWVYGVGELFNEGRSLVADTYINTSSGGMLNGEVSDEVEPWGHIRLDLTSCSEGMVSFQSDSPEFGSGEFSIVRLANSKHTGCEELD